MSGGPCGDTMLHQIKSALHLVTLREGVDWLEVDCDDGD